MKPEIIPGVAVDLDKEDTAEVAIVLQVDGEGILKIHKDDMHVFARSNCKKCYGRGWEKHIQTNRNVVVFNEATLKYDRARMEVYYTCPCTHKEISKNEKIEKVLILTEREKDND